MAQAPPIWTSTITDDGATSTTPTTTTTTTTTTTKCIHFNVGRKRELVVYDDERDTSEDIKNLFRCAAEAGPRDILKMYTHQGALVNISPRLESNDADSPYRLELVAVHSSDGLLLDEFGSQLAALEKRVQRMEEHMRDHASMLPQPVHQLRQRVDELKATLSNHNKSRNSGPGKVCEGKSGRPYWNRSKSRRKTMEEKRIVCDKFLNICDLTLTDEIRQCLRMPTFDNWQWEDEEILLLLQHMYTDLQLTTKFPIELTVLRQFLCKVYMNYNEVPFHNFHHCFCVSQMMYGIICCLNLPQKIGDLETLILLTSCICHDLDHPGYNNIYQINARTELALRYNDISPLENHHCSMAFNIMDDPSTNIFGNLSGACYKSVREGIIRCILATDMARHNEILSQFNDIVPVFNYQDRSHINLLCMVLIKVADISNEARPMDVAEPWLDCLLQEFFQQSDAEKLLGLPVTPFMDRDKITKPSSQCSFIGFVLLPLFESIGQLLPQLESLIVQPVRDALDYYKRLNEASKDARSRRSIEQASPDTSAATSPAQNNSCGGGGDDATADTDQESVRNLLTSDLSTDDQLQQLSLVFDDETANEVEVSEKTLTFKISTETRPCQWRPIANALSNTRRASLAVTPAVVNGAYRSASSAPPSHPTSPRTPSDCTMEKMQLQTPSTVVLPEPTTPPPTLTAPENNVEGSHDSRSPKRESALLSRLRHWTERFNLVSTDKSSAATVTTPLPTPATTADTIVVGQNGATHGAATSPQRRRIANGLSRFFSRSLTRSPKHSVANNSNANGNGDSEVTAGPNTESDTGGADVRDLVHVPQRDLTVTS